MSSLVQKTIDNGFWRLKNASGHDKFDNEVFCAERPNGIIDYWSVSMFLFIDRFIPRVDEMIDQQLGNKAEQVLHQEYV